MGRKPAGGSLGRARNIIAKKMGIKTIARPNKGELGTIMLNVTLDTASEDATRQTGKKP
jgi:hypothetical protein